MSGHASEDEPDPLRRAIARDSELLLDRIRALVYRLCGPLRREEIAERAAEVLNEAVGRALKVAERFDSSRSPIAWLIGFALRILHEQRRGASNRPVAQTDVSEEAWRRALEALCTVDSETATIRLDIQQALAKLDEKQRQILQLRYFEGLDGEELARAVDAPSAGAARVRLARALQALRARFGAIEEEP